MNLLLDTCTLSELRKPSPDAGVLGALTDWPSDCVYISVLSVGEIANGITRLPDGQKQRGLFLWLDHLLLDYENRLLPFDAACALRWGALTATCRAKGQTLSTLDGMIAATALVHHLTVVTRNVRDFQATGVSVWSPWDQNG
jgi:predicted nucleic acid-binding protein